MMSDRRVRKQQVRLDKHRVELAKQGHLKVVHLFPPEREEWFSKRPAPLSGPIT